MKSKVLVLIQFSSLLGIIYFGKLLSLPHYLLPIILFSILLGVYAIFIKKLKVNIEPIPTKGMILIRSGPYRFIRHPMYTSLLLFSFTILISQIDIIMILLFSVLLIDLLIKINFEESLLIEEFNEYVRYQNETKKLIPFIY